MTCRHSAACLFLIGAIAFLLTGCDSAWPPDFAAHKIADALPGVLGTADHYDVKVSGSPWAVGRGHLSEVSIDGQNVRVSNGLTLDTLNLDVRNVVYDIPARRVRKMDPIEFVGTLSQDHLSSYLATAHVRPGTTVNLERSDVLVSMPVGKGFVSATARVAGTLQPTGPADSQLNFVVDRAHLGMLPLPAGLVNLAIRRLNPVVDLTGMKIPISLDSTDVVAGVLVLKGSADAAAVSAAAKSQPEQ